MLSAPVIANFMRSPKIAFQPYIAAVLIVSLMWVSNFSMATQPTADDCENLIAGLNSEAQELVLKYRQLLLRAGQTNVANGASIAQKIMLRDLRSRLLIMGVSPEILDVSIDLAAQRSSMHKNPTGSQGVQWGKYRLDVEAKQELPFANMYAMLEDGTTLLTKSAGFDEDHIFKWDFATKTAAPFGLKLADEFVFNAVFSKDGRWIYSSAHTFMKFDRDNLSEPPLRTPQHRVVTSGTLMGNLVISPDEKHLAAYGLNNGSLLIYTTDLVEVFSDIETTTGVAHLSFSADSRYLLRSHEDRGFSVIKIENGRGQTIISNMKNSFRHVEFHPDRNSVVYLNDKQELMELDLETKVEVPFSHEWKGAEDFRLSRDGQFAILFGASMKKDERTNKDFNFVVVNLNSGVEVAMKLPPGWGNAKIAAEAINLDLYAFANAVLTDSADQSQPNFVVFDLKNLQTHMHHIDVNWVSFTSPYQRAEGVFDAEGRTLVFYDYEYGILKIDR